MINRDMFESEEVTRATLKALVACKGPTTIMELETQTDIRAPYIAAAVGRLMAQGFVAHRVVDGRSMYEAVRPAKMKVRKTQRRAVSAKNRPALASQRG